MRPTIDRPHCPAQSSRAPLLLNDEDQAERKASPSMKGRLANSFTAFLCCSLLSMAQLACSDGTAARTESTDASSNSSGGSGQGDTTTGNSAPSGGRSSATGGSSSEGGTGALGQGTSSGGQGSAASGGSQQGSGGSSELEPPVSWPMINGIQWADTDGLPIQAHGGGMLKVGEYYYWFGENRNPDGTFYAVSAYRSRDLRRFEHVHDVLTMDSAPGLKPANIERPKVVFNESTQRYVMWAHWENGEHYGEARAAVASSDTVDGDYTYHGSFRPLQDSGVIDHDKPGYMSRDCTLFVDDDGKGYFLSSSNENYDLHLYSLTDDYLAIKERAAKLFEGEHREAPALFKRQGTYFLLTSGSTGWSPNQAKYATSQTLTGGWSSLKEVADGTTFHSQSTYVLPIEGTEGTQYLYMGDRWAGAWGGKVNDSSYIWQPISFPTDSSMSMNWANTLQVDTERGSVAGAVNTFSLANKLSALLLTAEGQGDQNSDDLVIERDQALKRQGWRFNYDGSGHFHLSNEGGDKVIDVPDESTQDGVLLHLWDNVAGDHQAWRILDVGDGFYRIMNKKSALYIGVENNAQTEGAHIEQQSRSDSDAQLWQIQVAP